VAHQVEADDEVAEARFDLRQQRCVVGDLVRRHLPPRRQDDPGAEEVLAVFLHELFSDVVVDIRYFDGAQSSSVLLVELS